MYADDTNLFYSHKNIKALFHIVNKELENINEWFKVNKLSLNVKKTNFILFHPKWKSDYLPLNLPKLTINDYEITHTTTTKFLGVLLDENMTWKEHIKTIESKISKNLGILYRTKHVLNRECLKNLYFSFVNTYVQYANIAWGSTCRTNLKKINSKMKQASRIITGNDKYAHARPLMKSLNMLNVYQLNIYQTISFMYKVKNCKLPRVFNSKFQAISHKYPTSYSQMNFEIPKRVKHFYEYAISYRGPYLWNYYLDNKMKEEVNISLFQKFLKKTLHESENETTYF